MQSILEELFDSNIYPEEQMLVKDPEYQHISQKISDFMDTWREKLSGDDYKQLEGLLDLRCELSSKEAATSFMHGFKLSTLIMIEVFGGKSGRVREGC